jgi:putative membrane protein
MLLEAEPDAPRHLAAAWAPERIEESKRPTGALTWIAGGLAVLIVTWACFSIAAFVTSQFHASTPLGVLASSLVAVGIGLIAMGVGAEWRAYRSLKSIDDLRRLLARDDAPVADLRAAAERWLATAGVKASPSDTVTAAIRGAATPNELRHILRTRVQAPLHAAAVAVGQRAAVEGAAFVAICPHPSWDGLIAAGRGWIVIREVAQIYGIRPGLTATLVLVRHVLWTAAGTTAVTALSQGLADKLLTDLPIIKHVTGAVPGMSATALRLYRLAGLVAEACSPVSVETSGVS